MTRNLTTNLAWWRALLRVALGRRTHGGAAMDQLRRTLVRLDRDDTTRTSQEVAADRLSLMVAARRNSPEVVDFRKRRAAALMGRAR